MKKTNIAELRSGLSQLLDYVQKGKELLVQKRNIVIAKIIPVQTHRKNKMKLGCGKGSIKFHGDVTQSIMEDDWEMHE